MITQEQLNKIVGTLNATLITLSNVYGDESWNKLAPETQKDVIDSLESLEIVGNELSAISKNAIKPPDKPKSLLTDETANLRQQLAEAQARNKELVQMLKVAGVEVSLIIKGV